jgi:hypothetical protein
MAPAIFSRLMAPTLDRILSGFGDLVFSPPERLYCLLDCDTFSFSLGAGDPGFVAGDMDPLRGVLLADVDRKIGTLKGDCSLDWDGVSHLSRSNKERSYFRMVPDDMVTSVEGRLGVRLSDLSVMSRTTGCFCISSSSWSRLRLEVEKSQLRVTSGPPVLLEQGGSCSLGLAVHTLVELADRLEKEFVMLATLNFRIIVEAELRTRFSLLARLVIPGNGRMLRLQTSASKDSSRARSFRDGARIGILELVVKSDWDRLIGKLDMAMDGSLNVVVFFSMI